MARQRWILASTLGLCCVASSGCMSAQLTDEMAETMEATRPDNVRVMRAFADAAERLPGTLDAINSILSSGSESTERLRVVERDLVSGVARITSGTALAVERLADLVRTVDSASRSAEAILRDAEESAVETRADRRQIVASVAAISSSAQTLMRQWEEQSAKLRVQEDRAVRSLANLSDATARAAGDVASITSTASHVGGQIDTDMVSVSGSVALILEDLAKVTHTLSSEKAAAGGLLANGVGGFLGVIFLALVAFGVRALFRRAVAKAVSAQ